MASRKSPASAPADNKPGKEVSAMAWVEDPAGKVLMVKQRRGRRLWALPGGKVGVRESLPHALAREILEETGLKMIRASACEFYDRPEKSNLTVLFRAHVADGKPAAKDPEEIETIAFRDIPPKNSTPSLQYFWRALRPEKVNSKAKKT